MSLPESVTIVEVGPRDGFQMEREFIPTASKIQIINDLAQAGLCFFEATSFVSPKAIPQMADAAEVIGGVERIPGLHLAALVPNPKGAQNAAAARVDEMVVFVSASESHNKSNVNRTIAESLSGFEEVAEIAASADIPLHGAIAVSFGCPFEGNVPTGQVLKIIQKMSELGIGAISLGDTTGMATPPLVRRLCGEIIAAYPDLSVNLHFHNTRGIGLVNVYEALLMGLTRFESSVAGLGGCPFAPGASGNICTEDLVYLMDELGIRTGVDLRRLVDASLRVEKIIGRTLPGQVMKSGPRLNLHTFPAPAGR